MLFAQDTHPARTLPRWLAAVALLCACPPVGAAVLQFGFGGVIDREADIPFGLQIGDDFSGTVSWDSGLGFTPATGIELFFPSIGMGLRSSTGSATTVDFDNGLPVLFPGDSYMEFTNEIDSIGPGYAPAYVTVTFIGDFGLDMSDFSVFGDLEFLRFPWSDIRLDIFEVIADGYETKGRIDQVAVPAPAAGVLLISALLALARRPRT